MSSHTENAFQTAIQADLVTTGGYAELNRAEFDEERALFSGEVVAVVKATQPKRWQQLEGILGARTEATLLDSLTKELASKGALHVLRYGFKCYGRPLHLAYFQPNTGMNPEARALYDKNRLGVACEVGFTSVLKRPDGTNRRCVIDMVLVVGGIPVVTVELKNPTSGQTVADACHQYKTERDGCDPLFRFKERALVHFAVDTEEVWMTTCLNGADTVFLPFNRGHNYGAGNPSVAGTWKTHYLWDEVLQADSLLDILHRFMHLEVKEKKIRTRRGVQTKRKETMIFPRYHQLDAVRKLLAHARTNGAGHNYLIQHSAGSGKTNSIAWLAHRLASLHDAADTKIFHSVVVITDRRVLDQQLQDAIYQFEHKTGVVQKIDEDTQQLAKALSDGTPIIISTIQKFPFIAQALSTLEAKNQGVTIDTAGRRFAVIVDEAHSSQSGETMKQLKGLLNQSGIAAAVASQIGDEEDDDLSDEEKASIAAEAMERAQQPNLSFFAFTATPKFKTKAVFNEPGPSGVAPFHEYAMRQAIEEGFIMDVLQNYTTYQRFYGLVKQSETDPLVPRKEASKALGRFMALHPVNIEQVVTVIVEHFRHYVMHEMGGRAKAMVVTGSRLQAVKYKQAFDAYVKRHGYEGIRSLVAFSGTVYHPDEADRPYTEVGMNDGIAESELPEAFDGEDYRVLLVAEKYQTGFDQPQLQTMYIVRRLAGVQAVQTLSRLNRTAPGKTRTFVLDFENDEDEIYTAFKPYYEYTPVEETTDPQRLNDLQHAILEHQIFTMSEVNAFAKVWYRQRRESTYADHKAMNGVLSEVVEIFEQTDEEAREAFRGQLGAFKNLYAFLSQIIPFQDSELERFYTFIRHLSRKLPAQSGREGVDLDDDVALKYFRLQQVSSGAISLSDGTADSLKGPSDVGTGASQDEDVELSSLVDKLNERFGTSFTEADQLFFDQITKSAEQDEQIAEAARANNFDNFASFFDRVMENLFIDRMDGNEEIFAKVMGDRTFRIAAQDYIAREVYERVRNKDAANHVDT